MTDITTASVLVNIDPDDRHSDDEQRALDKALSIQHRCSDLNQYYHSASPSTRRGDPVVPLDSEEGRRRLDATLERTTDHRSQSLTTIKEAFEAAESVEEVAQDMEVLHAAHRVGSWAYPWSTFLYDGSRYSFGSPVVSRERVDDIVDHHDETLYLVDIELTY